MERVGQLEIRTGMSVGDVIAEFGRAGVMGAGGIARALDVVEDMVKSDATVFLGISGPAVPAGLGAAIADCITSGYVDAVVTSGANAVHDIIEAIGGSHYAGSFRESDATLRKKGIGRIGNVYTRTGDFEAFEKWVQGALGDIPLEARQNISPSELLHSFGERMESETSFLRAAYKHDVPVFCPAIADSMLGLQLMFFSQDNEIVLNVVKDMRELAAVVIEAQETGAIFLGGGVSKHYILGANLLREGIDYGVQITMDREECGSLGGAKLEEGISWGKVKNEAKLVTLVGDFTVLFPILLVGLKERIG